MCLEWRQCTPLGQGPAQGPRDKNALSSIVQGVKTIMGYAESYEPTSGLQKIPCINFPYCYLSFVKNRRVSIINCWKNKSCTHFTDKFITKLISGLV